MAANQIVVKESERKVQEAEAETNQVAEQMLELYKKRWSLIETYGDKMK